ncbi:hypothetical protein HKCCA1058_05915 [Rhodobacterales bacterium HKCCA1058]|nr:hypothetical protein [Rhodobacterales bacterium HKCCA1058]
MPPFSFVIVGVVRNCAKTLPSDLFALENALEMFGTFSWFIVESDSDDETVKVLDDLERNRSNFKYVSLGDLRSKFSRRTERLALCRNQYLDFISTDPSCEDIDYVVIADLDNVNTELTSAGIGSCWKRSDWDVCCANQRGPYYDIWALRHPLWSPNDCWKQAKQLQKLGFSRFKSVFASVYVRMAKLPRNSEWVEVDSAFGGFAIYKRSALEGVKYEGLDENNEEVCEHVYLHQMIKSNGGKIFINPSLINGKIIDHARNTTKFGLIRFWVRCLVSELADQLKVSSIVRRIRNIFFA